MDGRRALAGPVAAALALAGCTGTGPAAPTATGRTSGSGAGTVSPSLRDVSTGLATPWGMARRQDGAHLVSLRDEALVVAIARDGSVRPVEATGPDGRVPGVQPQGEGGLLGLAVAPSDPTVVFAYLTSASDNRVVRMRFAGGRLGAPEPILTGIPKAGNHNGGQLAFGPDGRLYVTTGDAGDPSRAQDRASLGGKILRITTDGDPAPGNPFTGSPVWSLGHRNVQGIGWDGQGHMYASEFGQDTWDELNLIVPGRNYGWPEVEGAGTRADTARGFTAPLKVWSPAEASPSGLAVGAGSLWLAALRGERLWRVPLAGSGRVGTPQALLTGRLGRLRSVEIEPDGTLLVLTNNVSRGQARPGDDRLVRVDLTP